jgi:hypothetical protein
VFQLQEVSEKFDDENPPIEIPDLVEDDIDNDWVLTEEEQDAIIAAYWTAKGEAQ